MIRPASQIVKLRILATSDVHMHLLPLDYFTDQPTPGKGLQALAANIADLRRHAAAEDPPRQVLLVDNGDTLQGTALGDHLATCQPRDCPHPVAEVMNALGYDAMGLGNHDLDYGLDYLRWFARSLDAPLLSSNLRLEPPGDWLTARCLLSAQGLGVGVLSVLPPGTVHAMHAETKNRIAVDDMIEAVRGTAAQLRSAGADIVLGLAHTGLDSEDSEQALACVARTGSLDALVGGHQHGVFPGPVPPGIDAEPEAGLLHGVPTAMPGCNGTLLGVIDLDLEWSTNGCWAVKTSQARVVPASVATAAHDPAFDPILSAHAATRRALDRVIAATPVPLTSYFARVRPTAIHALIGAAKKGAIDIERRGTPFADLPLLSAVSVPRAGGHVGSGNFIDIPAGDFSARHLAELSVYANKVWAVQLSGAELAEWLEKSASAFAQVNGDGASGLFDASFPAFDFDVIDELEYAIDPTQPARYDRAGALRHPESRRVSDITYEGSPVVPDMQFLVAVSSFRACGGGRFPGLHAERPVLRPDRSVTDALRAQLTTGGVPPQGASWRFAASCAGTRTWFETGAGALHHLDEIAHLSPGRPAYQRSGFVRIPITLSPCA